MTGIAAKCTKLGHVNTYFLNAGRVGIWTAKTNLALSEATGNSLLISST
jgi:hypothetical protein